MAAGVALVGISCTSGTPEGQTAGTPDGHTATTPTNQQSGVVATAQEALDVDCVIDLNTGKTSPLPRAILRSLGPDGGRPFQSPGQYAASPDGSGPLGGLDSPFPRAVERRSATKQPHSSCRTRRPRGRAPVPNFATTTASTCGGVVTAGSSSLDALRGVGGTCQAVSQMLHSTHQ
jgi:hypothetical protein